MRGHKINRSILLFAAFLSLIAAVRGQEAAKAITGKEPVIIIPGLTGSELINSKTGEQVWFSSRRSKDDDIRLPISANLASDRDNLAPGDIMRAVRIIKILPETEIYERLINALETNGGYREGKWKNPPRDGYQDTFYVFPYDWRIDNVENARLLIRQIDQLRRLLKRPDLKFNIVAHSMGGLIARYAAMYGNADIPPGVPKPTWAGAKYFDKIFLLGTPNEGSVSTLDSLLNGFSYVGGGVNIPFIQNVDRFDVFTIQSAYQLLPHDGTLVAYNEELKRITLDIYDPNTWEEYDWAIWHDPRFAKKFSAVEQRNARAFFRAALARAKSFQAALDADAGAKSPVSFYLMGADCKETENAVLLVRDDKKDRWRTIFKPGNITTSGGEKLTDAQLKPLLLEMGDGVVPKSSLTGSTMMQNGKTPSFTPVSNLFQCESHSKLVTNPEIQGKLLALLSGAQAK